MRSYYTKAVKGRGMLVHRTKTGSGVRRMFRDKREGLGKKMENISQKATSAVHSAMKKFDTLSLDENINKPKKYISLNF